MESNFSDWLAWAVLVGVAGTIIVAIVVAVVGVASAVARWFDDEADEPW